MKKGILGLAAVLLFGWLGLVSAPDAAMAAKQYENGEYSSAYQVLKEGKNEQSAAAEYMVTPAAIKVNGNIVEAVVTLKNASWWQEFKVQSTAGGAFTDVKTLSENKDKDTRVVSFKIADMEQNVQAKVHIVVTGIPGFEYDNKYNIQLSFDSSKLKEKKEEAVKPDEGKPEKKPDNKPETKPDNKPNVNTGKDNTTNSDSGKGPNAGKEDKTKETAAGKNDGSIGTTPSSKPQTSTGEGTQQTNTAKEAGMTDLEEQTGGTKDKGTDANFPASEQTESSAGQQVDESKTDDNNKQDNSSQAGTDGETIPVSQEQIEEEGATTAGAGETGSADQASGAAKEEGGMLSSPLFWAAIAIVIAAAIGSIFYIRKQKRSGGA